MFGNGFRTATKIPTLMLHPTAEQLLRSLRVFALFAVDPGTNAVTAESHTLQILRAAHVQLIAGKHEGNFEKRS
jgi:hypothetical protein